MTGSRLSDAVLALMRETAQSELLPRFGQLEAHEIREKKPGDLVTVADEAAERKLTAGLQAILPGVPVVGEEAVAADPELVAEIGRAERAWVVDPLDGTANFAKGRPAFAIIIALVHQGRAVGGWIHDPVRGLSAAAERHAGAWLEGERVRYAAGLRFRDMKGFVGFKFRRNILEKTRPEALKQIGDVTSLNCAGQEYIDIMAGRRQFNLYRSVKPWDHAAGVLMVEEAGGHAAQFDGSPYSPTVQDAGLLTAPDGAAWQGLHEILLGSSLPLLGERAI